MTNRTGQWIYKNGANFVYDDLNRVTQIEQEHAWAVFARSHYQYDRVGREEAVWRDEDSGRGERFEYEPNDQVKKAWYRAQNVWTTTPPNEVKNEEFTYTPDKLNRASVASNGVVTNYAAPNGMNQYPSVGNAAIGYDDHFNIASYHGAIYIYDAQNRLVGGSMQATYDGLGRCVRRVTSAGTRLYTYDGWKPILEWNGNGSWQAWNIYGAGPDEILARNDATYGPTIYKLDKQGNVMALLDGSSNVVEKYFYDAFGYPTVTDHWGNETGHSSAYGNRFLFTGREWIAELGIYDYRHRVYSPGLGRFLQMDPLGLQTEGAKLSAEQKALFSPGGIAPDAFTGSEINLFRYCGDDPVDHSDATGLYWAFNYRDPKDEAAARAEIVRLEKMKSPIGDVMKQLRDSKNRITVGDLLKNAKEWEKWNVQPRRNGDNTNRTTPSDIAGARNGRGTGSYVELDPRNWSSVNGNRDPVIGAGHEFRHAAANDAGDRLSGHAEEERAQTFELLIREEVSRGR